MFLMVEGDRLASPGANAQTDEEEEYKEPCRQSNKEKFHAVSHLVTAELSGGSPDSNRSNHKQRSLLQ